MVCIYDGKKYTCDIVDVLIDVLEENVLDLDESNQHTFIEMCQENAFPVRYFTDGILDLDKILDDKEILFELITEYEIVKMNI